MAVRAGHVVAVAAVATGAFFVYRHATRARASAPKAAVPPEKPKPPIPPPTAIGDIAFEPGARTEVTLSAGQRFSVTWGPDVGDVVVTDTDIVPVVELGQRKATFEVFAQLPSGQVEPVVIESQQEGGGAHVVDVRFP